MVPPCRTNVRALVAMAFALLSGLYGGCQAVETHHVSASYYERDGMWCGNFDIGFEEARVATRTALADLRMPIYQEGPEHHGVFLDTRTPDNFEARVVILPPGRHGESTRIGVRVGGFGTHRKVCERLLDEVAGHLGAERHRYAVPAVPVPPPGAVTPASAPATAAPPQAPAAEPSLPPEPVPIGRP